MTFREAITEAFQRPIRAWHLFAVWAAHFVNSLVVFRLGWADPQPDWPYLMAFWFLGVTLTVVVVRGMQVAVVCLRSRRPAEQ